MRKFLFTYKPISKYGLNSERGSFITLSKETGDLSRDAKAAMGIFIASTGTLKKNDIISIQEVDDNGKFIGEPITPVDGTSILPTRK